MKIVIGLRGVSLAHGIHQSNYEDPYQINLRESTIRIMEIHKNYGNPDFTIMLIHKEIHNRFMGIHKLSYGDPYFMYIHNSEL